MLPGMIPGGLFGGATGPVVITPTANASFSSVTSVAGVAIGTASTDRMVVVAITTNSSTPSGLTIGGIAATKLIEASNTIVAQIWAAMVPTGTTATIAWTGSASGGYSAFAVTGPADVFAAATLSDITSPLSGSITIPSSGGFIAVTANGEQATGVAWTNATEYSDINAGIRHSAAYSTTAGATTLSVTTNSGTFPTLAAAAWG